VAKRLRFSITNLHELAHMWFGNLVTMKWWDDLWLNESFATFMSFLAMQESPAIDYFHSTCWVTFQQYAFWGISTDQLSSTHPIEAQIQSTDQAESLFDGISYGKGSAFLKQIYNVMGYEKMKQGLHRYFERFAWQNTSLYDFVDTLTEVWEASGDQSMGADFNLKAWFVQWLQTSGVNVLEPVV
jgi:aminopeptidase N